MSNAAGAATCRDRERERRAVVAHVSHCRYCRALLAYSERRTDRALLAAADELAAVHALNDAERIAWRSGRHERLTDALRQGKRRRSMQARRYPVSTATNTATRPVAAAYLLPGALAGR